MVSRLVDPNSPIPLYHQLSAVLRGRIADGHYGVGSFLPPEEELCAEFDVSRATMRSAVRELVGEGLVSRRRGVGTLILKAAQPPRGQHFRGSLSDLMGEMRRASVGDIAIERGAALPGRIAERLALPAAVGTVIRRTRTLGGRVFNRTVNYMADSYGELLTEKELRAESLMWLLSGKGVALVEAVQSVSAQAASVEIGRHLDLPFGAPVLFVERLVYGANRQPVELVQTWYRGDRYEYTVTFDLASDGRDDVHSQLA